MSRVSVQWYGDERLAEISRAADVALQATAAMMGREVRSVLSKTKGQTLKRPGQRNAYKASPPGTAPGWRSGRLAGSITTGKVGHLRYGIGTNVEYARIHELGGTINHPGGIFYTIGARGAVFLSEAGADRVRARGGFVGKTKPYPINMPRRPFLIPTLRRLESSGKLQSYFSQRFRANMKGMA
jgi:Mu-like prophage protein gpG